MENLYVLGGRQQSRRLFKNSDEWNLYEAALVLAIDTETLTVTKRFEYETPADARATARSSVLFKSGTLVGNRLYVCTLTEVLVIGLPEFAVLHRVSLPCFNDLHHVTVSHDGTLLAAVTGLDLVARFTSQGELREMWNVLGPDSPWGRFSPTVDYRKVETTKPHLSHPNFVFEVNGDVWATRLHQRDAMCLTDRSKRIELALEQPHDGLVRFGRMHFTLVDGRVMIANAETLQLEQVVDLKDIDNPNSLLGWCRGILPLTPTQWWVGFSRIRQTRFELYDLESRQRLRRVDLDGHGMDVVFGILGPVAANL